MVCILSGAAFDILAVSNRCAAHKQAFVYAVEPGRVAIQTFRCLLACRSSSPVRTEFPAECKSYLGEDPNHVNITASSTI